MARVLLVDDEKSIRETLAEFLAMEGHSVETASEAGGAVERLERQPPDLLITDLVLPGRDGLWLVEQARRISPRLQVLLLTGQPSLDSATRALRLGAADYLTKPVRRADFCRAVARTLMVQTLHDENEQLAGENRRHRDHLEELVRTRSAQLAHSEATLRAQFAALPIPAYVWRRAGDDFVLADQNRAAREATGEHPGGGVEVRASEFHRDQPEIPARLRITLETRRPHAEEMADPNLEGGGRRHRVVRYAWLPDDQVMVLIEDVTERRRLEEERERHLESARQSLRGAVEAMGRAVEARDPYTAGHQRKVGLLAEAIAGALGWAPARVEGLRVAGMVHDVGKISVPAEILSKPSRLTPVEFSLVRMHARTGFEILSPIGFDWPLAEAVRQHHERLDGSGYPQGLRGEAIMPEARVLAVADVVEAMSSHRPYRPALGVEAALEELQAHRGERYDPEAVDACLRVFRDRGFAFPAD